MRILSHTPTYNLKAVLKETGLSADVLRAWERRYGLPMPQRTPGGHRLYSEYDIEMVKWLKARQAEGFSISRAVKSWKEMVEAGRDPLAEMISEPAPPPPMERSFATQTHVELLRRAWLDACLEFNERKAEEILSQSFALYPVETVCMEILQRGLHLIGSDWYQGKVSVHQEHFASALAIRRLDALITTAPAPTRSQTVMIGCPPGEWHTFPVLLLSLLLRRRGLRIVYLGANITTERLEETAALIYPNLIVLAAQQLTTAASLRNAVLSLQKKQIPAAFGGLIFNRIPELRQRIPAYFLGESLDDAVQAIEELLPSPTVISSYTGGEDTIQNLAGLYREKRPMIEAGLYEMLNMGDLESKYLAEAITFFGSGLSAALELGDPAWLEADLEWMKHLLTGRQIPLERLHPFLTAYSRMVEEQIGPVGEPITTWIASYLNPVGVASLP